ncbi:hydrid cluster protein-associated redox disulfide domain protein [Halobacteroides halobius DSM 5150]|uniref:Hydrid cluster protein-associated redox disulfide domain protein n=1 Tax=Halobacteroides halobius (strain ATCC 35273 / DSM 5150 / MD-1) TaxID=748449 RepID=L0K802_HALHC|nr:DUF1858 domain-containing protein [Halobacteroides halobius]AGB41151.1 hydrid cluster protein-associated redox disulfide domain protein [Halobacteroides halobius DSM 5150]
MKVTKETSILKLLAKNPKAKEILAKYNLGCAECLGAMVDDLESAAKANDVEVEKLIEELNKLGEE